MKVKSRDYKDRDRFFFFSNASTTYDNNFIIMKKRIDILIVACVKY